MPADVFISLSPLKFKISLNYESDVSREKRPRSRKYFCLARGLGNGVRICGAVRKSKSLRWRARIPTMSSQEVTQLLVDWGRGDRSAFDKLFPLVQGELRRIARRQMSHERPGHTLQATALVN